MARTPVARTPLRPQHEDEHDRRRGIPLWVWPLIPLLLGVLALGLSLRGNDEQPEAGTSGQNTTNGSQAAPLTDMLTVVNNPNPASYVGQPATFTNVQVQSVPGDRGFWVGPDQNQQLFVVIDEANAGRAEGDVQITPGQAVTLGGVIEQIPPADQIPPEWGLTAEGAAVKPVYLHAQQVRVEP